MNVRWVLLVGSVVWLSGCAENLAAEYDAAAAADLDAAAPADAGVPADLDAGATPGPDASTVGGSDAGLDAGATAGPDGGLAGLDAGTSPPPDASVPSPVAKPRGTFASAGGADSAVVNHAQVRGVLVRAGWNEIEPGAGQFDFTRIEGQISKVRAAGKGWSLAVLGGPSAPSWLYASPYNVASLDIDFRMQPVKVPKFWDPTLQQRLGQLVAALASRYGGDPLLELVYIAQMSGNGVEGHFNGNSNDKLTSQGFTEDLWVSSVLQAADTYAAAFPTKPIAIELHDILGSANAGKRIMAAIEADPAKVGQQGVAVWWLSGRTDYQADLLTAFSSFKGDIYAQLIDKAANPGSFPSGDYAQAFVQAKALNIRYVEPWEVDFKSGLQDALFADFNAWAAAP